MPSVVSFSIHVRSWALSDLIAERGVPKMIVKDNGTELTLNAVLACSEDVGVEWHYIAPTSRRRTGSS